MAPQLAAQIWVPDLRRIIGAEIAMSWSELHSDLPADLGSEDDSIDGAPSLQDQIARSHSPFVRDSIDASFLAHSTQEWREMPADPRDWQTIQRAMGDKEDAIEADHTVANYFAQEFSPAFIQSMNSVGTVQAHDGLLLASVALLRARLDQGALPRYLPPSLGNARIDPFDGNLLRYRPKGSGFLLYSIGQDRVDDGGRRRSSDDPGSEMHNDEVMEFQ